MKHYFRNIHKYKLIFYTLTTRGQDHDGYDLKLSLEMSHIKYMRGLLKLPCCTGLLMKMLI